MQADPDLGRDPEAAGQVRLHRAHRRDQVQPRQDRAPSVVLMRLRKAEAGQDAVPHVLHDVAAVPFDRLAGCGAIEREQVAQLLGLDLFGHHRGADQIGEEQRHERPLADRRLLGLVEPLQQQRRTLVGGIDCTDLLGGGPRRLDVPGGE